MRRRAIPGLFSVDTRKSESLTGHNLSYLAVMDLLTLPPLGSGYTLYTDILTNALIGYYSVCHKTVKWYKTFFYHFVDIAVVNSYLLHKELFKCRKDPTQTRPFTHKAFREHLAKEMLEYKGEDSEDTPPKPPTACVPVFFDSEETRVRKYCKRCHDAGTPRVVLQEV